MAMSSLAFVKSLFKYLQNAVVNEKFTTSRPLWFILFCFVHSLDIGTTLAKWCSPSKYFKIYCHLYNDNGKKI